MRFSAGLTAGLMVLEIFSNFKDSEMILKGKKDLWFKRVSAPLSVTKADSTGAVHGQVSVVGSPPHPRRICFICAILSLKY